MSPRNSLSALAGRGKVVSICANAKEPGPVKPAPFVYHAPKTLEQAVAVLAEVAPEDGRVLAGGQSLVPTMAFRLARPAHLVAINQPAGLDRLAVENGSPALGACLRPAAVHRPAPARPPGRL